MKTIQRIGIFFLLLVFLFGTTGLSMLHHVCNNSRQANTRVYPEFFKSSGSSCCEDESTGYSCSSHVNGSKDDLPQNINAAPCCKSVISFFKLEVLTVRLDKLVINSFSTWLPLDTIILNQISHAGLPFLQPAHFQFYSPPLFGKLLVYYLHQMKVPAHPSCT